MHNKIPPRPDAIAHINEIFTDTTLEVFLEEKLTQLIEQEKGRPAAPPESLKRCVLANETQLLEFLKQRLEHLQHLAGTA